MDTVTHALSGALLGRAAGYGPTPDEPPASVRGWLCFTAAAFPDIDVLLRFVDELLYLEHHRTWTHSLLLLPLWALLLGGACHRICRRLYRLERLVLIAAFGIAIHIAGDLITAYGTSIFAPLSRDAPALGWVLVIDPWLTLLLVSGLVASRYRLRIAAFGLAASVVFVLFQGAINYHVAATGRVHAAAIGWHGARVHAMAQPFSPFNRMLIVERNGEYQRARVNAWRRTAPQIDPDDWRLLQLYRSYRPLHDSQWESFELLPERPGLRRLVREAWRSPALEPFRAFARHPVFYSIDRDSNLTCVWFTDLRYWYDPLPAPFRFGGCRTESGKPWALYHHRLDGVKERVRGGAALTGTTPGSTFP